MERIEKTTLSFVLALYWRRNKIMHYKLGATKSIGSTEIAGEDKADRNGDRSKYIIFLPFYLFFYFLQNGLSYILEKEQRMALFGKDLLKSY